MPYNKSFIDQADFSVGMELENEKTESVNENENKKTKHHFCI